MYTHIYREIYSVLFPRAPVSPEDPQGEGDIPESPGESPGEQLLLS